ncbi:MAG: hypothetical protein ACOYD0_13055 [Candidatus Nanopelagicales bacterium]
MANTTATSNTTYENSIYNSIKDQLAKLGVATDANSATIKAQTDAYDIKSARELEQARNALAEQAYAGGDLGTGGYQQNQQRALESAAAARSGFVGNAVKDAETARLKAYTDTLGVGASAENARNTLTQDQSQFTAKMGQEESQFARTLSQSKDALAQQMGFNYAQLNQQDRQFVDDLAWKKEESALQAQLQREGMSASAAAASAGNSIAAQRLAMDQEDQLFQRQVWMAQNPQELIDARNRQAIAEALGYTG